ncbi:MAG: hypothetical protein AB1384_08580 [Actinomycetota bacterium]
MKRTVVFLILLVSLSLTILGGGCGGSQEGDQENGGHTGGEVDLAEYERGISEGQARGYERGFSDGKQGVYDPGVEVPSDLDEDYAAGYKQGWVEGYEDGHADAVAEAEDAGGELAEVEAAMLAFVRQNSAPGMEFRIENIVIHGNQAAGIAVCTSEKLESPLVVMEKTASGWSAVDFGTGIEPPSWYEYR